MEQQLSGFKLPKKPKAGKAMVYFVYRNDVPEMLDAISKANNLTNTVEVFYTPSTSRKVARDNSEMFKMANVFTLGLIDDKISKEKTSIGKLNPGHYRTKQLDPGYYEFNRTLVVPDLYVLKKENNVHVKLEADKTHFVFIKSGSFFNRYAGTFQHNIY